MQDELAERGADGGRRVEDRERGHVVDDARGAPGDAGEVRWESLLGLCARALPECARAPLRSRVGPETPSGARPVVGMSLAPGLLRVVSHQRERRNTGDNVNKKPIVVEIDDLREFVGGGADLAVQDRDNASAEFTFPSNTIMCYRFKEPTKDPNDWTVIKGQ